MQREMKLQEPRESNDEREELLSSYKPIRYADSCKGVETLRNVTEACLEEWAREVSMYEQVLPSLSLVLRDIMTSTGQRAEIPRRNYLNSDGQVYDPELFPYHSSCYPLLDAYDSLNVAYRENVPIIRPFAGFHDTRQEERPGMEEEVPGSLLCSTLAIQISISGVEPLEDKEMLEDEWKNGLEHRLKSHGDPNYYLRYNEGDIDYANEHHFGLATFPENANDRADLLFKLLRHAMSDLQNDYKLAHAIILRMSAWKLLQDANCLRKVVAVLDAGQVQCDGHCFERFWANDDSQDVPDHSCHDWKLFESSISKMLLKGIEYFTSEHAVVISSAVLFACDKLNPAAAELEASLIAEAIAPNPKKSVEDKQKTLLKRKLFLWRNTEFEDDEENEDEENEVVEETPTMNWLDELVIGLGTHATFARARIVQIRVRLLERADSRVFADTDVLVLLLRKSIDSFYNCARCLVDIGASALRRLPSNRRTVGFCSRLVLCLTQIFLDPNPEFMKHDKTYLKAGKSLIDPNRYAESILAATKNCQQRNFRESTTTSISNLTLKEAIDVADTFLRSPPDADVQDLVRCLFAKDLVDVSISRCGYGDIQVWWGQPVSPLDPLLFFETCQSPRDDVLDVCWDTDEEGAELWGDRLNARHDFALVLLLRAWHSPWTVASHHSFQRPFRQVVRTLLLCANRMRMPIDVATHVSSYLRRDWWPDERARCWCEDCLAKHATNLMDQKLFERLDDSSGRRMGVPRSQRSFEYCRGCYVAQYCSEAHRQTDYRGGHKGMCGKPPYRVPGHEEDMLFQDAVALPVGSARQSVLNDLTTQFLSIHLCSDENDIVGDDDSGSWESVDSDDEQENESHDNPSFTETVYRFFEKESYKSQRDIAARVAGGLG